MSEQTITGICTEIAQKPGSEWVEFHIDGGGKYPVRLSTKLQPLIELGKAVGSQLAIWTYNEQESEKVNPNSGKPYVNRYLERVEVGGSVPEPDHPDASSWSSGPVIDTSASASPTPAHKPLIAGDKDRAITRMACLKAAALMHQGQGYWSLTSDQQLTDTAGAIIAAAARFETWVYRDIDEVPFE